jgi:hypothetical protein
MQNFLLSRRVLVSGIVAALVYTLAQRFEIPIDKEFVNQVVAALGLWFFSETAERSDSLSSLIKDQRFVALVASLLTALLGGKLGSFINLDPSMIQTLALAIQGVLLGISQRAIVPVFGPKAGA